MKKTFLLVLILLCVSSVMAAQELHDVYETRANNTNVDTVVSLPNAPNLYGQNFNLSSNQKFIDLIQLKLGKQAITNNVRAAIFSSSCANFDTCISSGTNVSEIFYVPEEEIPNLSGEHQLTLINMTFRNSRDLTPGGTYWVYLDWDSADMHVAQYTASGNKYNNGTRYTSGTSNTGIDLYFQTYEITNFTMFLSRDSVERDNFTISLYNSTVNWTFNSSFNGSENKFIITNISRTSAAIMNLTISDNELPPDLTFYLENYNTSKLLYYTIDSSNYLKVITDNRNLTRYTNTIPIYLVSLNETINYTRVTSNGVAYFPSITLNLSLGEWDIVVEEDNWHPVRYPVLVNGLNQTIHLYFLNASEGDAILYTISDEYDQPVSGAIVELLRFYPSLGTHYVIDAGRTNTDGEISFQAIFNQYYYKIRVYDRERNLLLSTESSRIYDTAIDLQVSLQENLFQSFEQIGNVFINHTYVNQSGASYDGYFRLEWIDTQGLVETACIKVDELARTQSTNVCYTCSNGTSGIITCQVNETAYQYKSVVLINTTTENSEYWMFPLFEAYNFQFGEGNSWGVLFSLAIVLTAFMIGVSASPTVGVVYAILGMGMVAMFGFLQALSFATLSIYIVLGGVGAYYLRE